MFKLLVCKVIFNATNCVQQKGESASLYDSACRYLHFCRSSFGHLSAHLKVKVVFLQGNIDFWGILYQQHIALFLLLACRTGENLRLTLTHGYLVLVVFAWQHLHTTRLEFSHLFHCGGSQEESCVWQVKWQEQHPQVATPTNNNTHKYSSHIQSEWREYLWEI